jgi:uncharacterized membrane protein
MDTKPSMPIRPLLSITLLTGGLSIIVVVALYRWKFPGPLTSDHEVWGQFGDYIGGVLNPIFGFLSFVLLIAALVLQSHELRLSTKELAASAKALADQSATLDKQNFEHTFFQMLHRFSEVAAAVSYDKEPGRQNVEKLYKRLRVEFENTKDQPFALQAELSYASFHSNWRKELDHYFRTLYHIFKFIDQSRLSDKEKSDYANIARAQLSTYELCLLFYNGTYGEGKEGFKPLIEKYGLLKHVNARDLIAKEHREPGVFYRKSAFQSYENRIKG